MNVVLRKTPTFPAKIQTIYYVRTTHGFISWLSHLLDGRPRRFLMHATSPNEDGPEGVQYWLLVKVWGDEAFWSTMNPVNFPKDWELENLNVDLKDEKKQKRLTEIWSIVEEWRRHMEKQHELSSKALNLLYETILFDEETEPPRR